MNRPYYDFTNEEIRNVAQESFEDLQSNFESSSISANDIYTVIKDDFSMNGYEYAKELEDRGANAIDSIIVNALDNISYNFDELNKTKVKDWVLDNNIEPSFRVGDLVEYKNHGNIIQEVIKSIDYEKALYHIRIDNSSARLIPFEQVSKA